MRAELRKNKIIILDLYPFALVLSKNNSKYVQKITKTCVFVKSLLADIVIPVPISK
jgi:hypothetical protein